MNHQQRQAQYAARTKVVNGRIHRPFTPAEVHAGLHLQPEYAERTPMHYTVPDASLNKPEDFENG